MVRISALLALTLAVVRFASACDGDANGVTRADASNDGPELDAPTGADSEAPASRPPPSYCEGLVFYASLDSSLSPELGHGQPFVYGAAGMTPTGHFGGSIALYQDAGDPDAGANLYFIRQDGGLPVFPDTMGTVSLWYRGRAISDDTPGTPVLWRPVETIAPAPTVGSGLVLAGLAGTNTFGVINTAPNRTETLLVFSKSSVRPFLRDGDFNHFAVAWRRDVSDVPTVLMAVNGGLGTIYDAGPDAELYVDAMPDDAGDLRVPYRGYTTKPWENDASTNAFRLGGTASSAAEGEIDDVAIWNRVLSFEEMAAIYNANAPIGRTCHVP